LCRKITTTTAQVTAELNIHLYDTVSKKKKKKVRRELQKFNNHGRVAVAKPLSTESNAQMREQWCHDHKTWTSDKWKHACESSLTL
jgi:hypothetical protein